MIEERDRQKDKEIEKLRASLREIQRDAAEKNAISNRRMREFQEYKQTMEQELSELQKRKDDEIESYRKRCVDAEHTAKVNLTQLININIIKRKWNFLQMLRLIGKRYSLPTSRQLESNFLLNSLKKRQILQIFTWRLKWLKTKKR